MASRWETVQVNGAPMNVFLDSPAGPGPHPGVIVIMHIGGVDEFGQTMVSRLAEAGYVAAMPDHFHAHDDDILEQMAAQQPGSPDYMTLLFSKIGKLRDNEVEADTNATLALLRSLPEVGSAPVGITGFCMGGRIAYLMAARNPELAASGVFYGGAVSNAWGDGQSPLEQTANINCPIIAFFGEDDRNPSPEHMQEWDAELTKHGKQHAFHSYPGAGHGFQDFNNSRAYREEASKDSWAKLLDFFQEHLKAAVTSAG